MTHPNRSKHRTDDPARTPTPAEIRRGRLDYELTQTAAAELIYCSLRAWQQWEEGSRRMHPAFWELWCAKAPGVLGPRRAAR